jgi:3-methyladenine DNA glycosylase AlkD
MTVAEILKELESLGNEQTRKTYARHGMTGNILGVRYGDMEKIVKRIRKQPELAAELWESGFHEARIIALKIADPDKLTKATLSKWARDVGESTTMDIANLISRSKHAVDLVENWTNAPAGRQEWKHVVGWTIITVLAGKAVEIDRSWFAAFLPRIEKEIAGALNWVRYAMNNALIAIGGCDDSKLRDAALAVAKKIGKVEVDHGDTSCKTPDAGPYILKIHEHRKAKKKTAKRK